MSQQQDAQRGKSSFSLRSRGSSRQSSVSNVPKTPEKDKMAFKPLVKADPSRAITEQEPCMCQCWCDLSFDLQAPYGWLLHCYGTDM